MWWTYGLREGLLSLFYFRFGSNFVSISLTIPFMVLLVMYEREGDKLGLEKLRSIDTKEETKKYKTLALQGRDKNKQV